MWSIYINKISRHISRIMLINVLNLVIISTKCYPAYNSKKLVTPDGLLLVTSPLRNYMSRIPYGNTRSISLTKGMSAPTLRASEEESSPSFENSMSDNIRERSNPDHI
uniref:Uncharacterized protein n=1 Tax=Rhizophora mucronata TaxID=61149 RepID=A0A2P2P5I9_RHIMU